MNFDAYQYGYRKRDGSFEFNKTQYWTSSEEADTKAWVYGVGFYCPIAHHYDRNAAYLSKEVKEKAVSVRYIKE